MREKSLGSVLRRIAPWIIVVGILEALISQILSLAGLPLYGIVDLDPIDGVAIASNAVLISLISIVNLVIAGLIGKGMTLSIYRIIRYDSKIAFEDIFFFFNRRFLFNAAFVILESLLIVIGFALFIIPGIILSLGLVPSAIWLAKYQEGEGLGQVFRSTWASTKGKKGFIFLQYLLLALAYIVMALILGLFFGVSISAIFSSEPSLGIGFIGIIFGIALGLLAVVVTMLIGYLPQIAVIMELVGENRFDDRPDEEVLIEEDLAQEEADSAFVRQADLQRKIDAINRDLEDQEDQD